MTQKQKTEEFAKKIEAKIDVWRRENNTIESINIEAPQGYHWKATGGHALVTPGSMTPGDTNEAWKDAFQQMEYGVEKCSVETPCVAMEINHDNDHGYICDWWDDM